MTITNRIVFAAQDIYYSKRKTKINSEIERLRIEASASIINRRDTINCISIVHLFAW